MALQRTLSIIKPDAVSKNQIGPISQRLTAAGLWIVAARMQQLTRGQTIRLYTVHQERPFFANLIQFMTSGPIMLQVLAGENAIATYRNLMGATDPKKAKAGTLRAEFGSSIERNAVHGSDTEETAAYELALLFSESDIYPIARS
jgi:nucleoside-diphosphate kinase